MYYLGGRSIKLVKINITHKDFHTVRKKNVILQGFYLYFRKEVKKNLRKRPHIYKKAGENYLIYIVSSYPIILQEQAVILRCVSVAPADRKLLVFTDFFTV